MWNQLIYDKFRYQIKIDKKKILKEIKSSKNKSNEKIYLLSEIVFEIKNKDEFNEKKDKIEKSINEIGFKNSANIYSISDSSKFGGEIGWIAEKELSKKIFNEINNLEINQYTRPILTGSSFLILKIDDLKYEEKKIDLKSSLIKRLNLKLKDNFNNFQKFIIIKLRLILI